MSHVNDFAMVLCPRWDVSAPWTAPAYVIEAVRSRGFRVQFLDYNIRLYYEIGVPELWVDDGQFQFWKSEQLDYLLDRVDLDEIDAPVVGFSLTETNLAFSIGLARRIRQNTPDTTIIFGGHRLFFPEDPQEQAPPDVCDAIVKGEGELTLLDILQNGIDRTVGTYTPDAGRWVFHGDRPLMEDLDAFPWPRYEEVNWEHFPARRVCIMGSRGCINHCAFCNDIVRARHKYRRRSAEHIAEEMFHHKRRWDIQEAVFNDPLLNGDYANLDRLCELLLEGRFDRPWSGNLAVRGNMPEELMRKAHRAGLHRVAIGLESGSAHVLSLMHKRFSLDEAEWFIRAVSETGIAVHINLIVGFPGETDEDFAQTLQFLARISPFVSRLDNVATFNLDRSYVWDHLDAYGVVKSPEKRHISWQTADGSNTYAVRCERANRLLRHAERLGLVHSLSDLRIERSERTLDMAAVKRRHAYVRFKRVVKKALSVVGIAGRASRMS